MLGALGAIAREQLDKGALARGSHPIEVQLEGHIDLVVKDQGAGRQYVERLLRASRLVEVVRDQKTQILALLLSAKLGQRRMGRACVSGTHECSQRAG